MKKNLIKDTFLEVERYIKNLSENDSKKLLKHIDRLTLIEEEIIDSIRKIGKKHKLTSVDLHIILEILHVEMWRILKKERVKRMG